MATDALEATVVNEAVIAGKWRELSVVVWRASTITLVLRRLLDAQAAHARSLRGEKLAVITVLDAKSITVPDAAMRALIDESRRFMESNAKAECVVLPGGLVAATIRGIIAGITLAARPSHPTKVVATLEDACAFTAPLLVPSADGPVTAAHLRSMIESMQSDRFDKR
ncbi:MAG: hypothetical protein U0269_22830 [Polyangiales bacterium]